LTFDDNISQNIELLLTTAVKTPVPSQAPTASNRPMIVNDMAYVNVLSKYLPGGSE
jgi:hypothetical protein